MTIPREIQDAEARGAERERRRLIGVVLAAYGRASLAGQTELAAALDRLAIEMEHGPAALGLTPENRFG